MTGISVAHSGSIPLSRALSDCSRYHLRALPSPLSPPPVFLTFNVRMKNGLSRIFSSRRVTLGNHQGAFQALLWHYPLLLTYNVRMKNCLSRTFDSRRITSGNHRHAFQGPLWHFPIFPTYHVRMKIGLSRTLSSRRITSGNSSDDSRQVLKLNN